MRVIRLQSPLSERHSWCRIGHGSRKGIDLPLRRRPGGFAAISFHRRPGSIAILLVMLLAAATATARAQVSASGAPGQKPLIRVTTSPQIFATLCALYAAGYSTLPADASPQLKEMALQLGTLQGPAVTALREFYRTHRLPSDSDTLARYVSFAMVVGPPPFFQYVFPTNQLPPDVHSLDGFQKLLGDFYTEDHIGRLWTEVKPYYQAQTASLRGPVSSVVSLAVGYARRMNSFTGSRRFTVYVDPLVGAETNFRIYSESYEIAVNPGSPAAIGDIRLAFLHYLLDPLAFSNPAIIESKKYLFNFAVRAPRLPGEYREDFVAFTDECLVRAVALRLASLFPAARQAALTQEDRDGFILVRPLYNGLDAYESSLGSLADYFPQWIASIDVKAEAARDQQIVFSPAPAGASRPAPQESTPGRIEQWLALGNRQIAAQDGKEAVTTFEGVLQFDPGNTRAKYGLAVASAMTGQAERARQLFEQVASSPSSDPSARSWSHVYLGRMNDLSGHRPEALVQYRAALAIAGIPPTARAAAEEGIKQAFTAEKSDSGATQHR